MEQFGYGNLRRKVSIATKFNFDGQLTINNAENFASRLSAFVRANAKIAKITPYGIVTAARSVSTMTAVFGLGIFIRSPNVARGLIVWLT